MSFSALIDKGKYSYSDIDRNWGNVKGIKGIKKIKRSAYTRPLDRVNERVIINKKYGQIDNTIKSEMIRKNTRGRNPFVKMVRPSFRSGYRGNASQKKVQVHSILNKQTQLQNEYNTKFQRNRTSMTTSYHKSNAQKPLFNNGVSFDQSSKTLLHNLKGSFKTNKQDTTFTPQFRAKYIHADATQKVLLKDYVEIRKHQYQQKRVDIKLFNKISQKLFHQDPIIVPKKSYTKQGELNLKERVKSTVHSNLKNYSIKVDKKFKPKRIEHGLERLQELARMNKLKVINVEGRGMKGQKIMSIDVEALKRSKITQNKIEIKNAISGKKELPKNVGFNFKPNQVSSNVRRNISVSAGINENIQKRVTVNTDNIKNQLTTSKKIKLHGTNAGRHEMSKNVVINTDRFETDNTMSKIKINATSGQKRNPKENTYGLDSMTKNNTKETFSLQASSGLKEFSKEVQIDTTTLNDSHTYSKIKVEADSGKKHLTREGEHSIENMTKFMTPKLQATQVDSGKTESTRNVTIESVSTQIRPDSDVIEVETAKKHMTKDGDSNIQHFTNLNTRHELFSGSVEGTRNLHQKDNLNRDVSSSRCLHYETNNNSLQPIAYGQKAPSQTTNIQDSLARFKIVSDKLNLNNL